jgi:hypothetical protein
MATHTTMVYMAGELLPTGAPVDYDGPANWKFQPLDPDDLEIWLDVTADPERVEMNHRVSGEYLPSAPPMVTDAERRAREASARLAALETTPERHDRYGNL